MLIVIKIVVCKQKQDWTFFSLSSYSPLPQWHLGILKGSLTPNCRMRLPTRVLAKILEKHLTTGILKQGLSKSMLCTTTVSPLIKSIIIGEFGNNILSKAPNIFSVWHLVTESKLSLSKKNPYELSTHTHIQ